MKMTTDISAVQSPTPDKVENPLSETLKFFRTAFPRQGPPSRKFYDNLDFSQRGVQAYLTALPAVSIEGARRGRLLTGFRLRQPDCPHLRATVGLQIRCS